MIHKSIQANTRFSTPEYDKDIILPATQGAPRTNQEDVLDISQAGYNFVGLNTLAFTDANISTGARFHELNSLGRVAQRFSSRNRNVYIDLINAKDNLSDDIKYPRGVQRNKKLLE